VARWSPRTDDVFGLEALHFAEGAHKLLCELAIVAAAFGDELEMEAHARSRAEWIFVGVDADGVGGNVRPMNLRRWA